MGLSLEKITTFIAYWLAVSLAAVLSMGLAQQMRGAHYMSHTLWTAWLCWTAGLVVDFVAQRWGREQR